MSSLVERLRIRSERKPLYNIGDSDDEADLIAQGNKSTSRSKPERFNRPDTKEDLCQACGESGDLLSCETCTYSYHSKCLLLPLKGSPESWNCPECVSPLNDIDKILDSELRPTAADNNDASNLGSKQIFVKQYLVKWKGFSYLHCTWVPEKEFLKAFRANPRLRTKLNNFDRQKKSLIDSGDEFVGVRPEWTTVDRILANREGDNEREYLVKWKELPYDECNWELESDISAYKSEIEKFKKIQSRGKSSSRKSKSFFRDSKESKKKSKEFQHFESSPDFLSGGSLHPYQLEGLNFLRYSWAKQTHVILADEMGLGKTIQSIAFLAALLEENISPFLVVAPLSTLRNWEREFALWAPQMNVVMYVGSSQARAVIREHEFFFPKGEFKKHKKKKGGHVVSESKQDRIKFDVLLTSYEMINMDSSSMKPLKWECMIVDEGHRLKNKDSKLFLTLTQYSSNHRVLLTGTPLQNNLDELFMLMHFLDAGKFGSLEEFQEEFKDINQEEQVARLHKMLAPHLLRRVKKDVLKDMPPKKELILRVDLCSKQKEYYKAILTRNYELLTRRGGGQISLINVVMELRKLCCHAYMLEGVEPDVADPDEFFRQLLDGSGKLTLLDKMMVKLKEQGHRVLIYTQFQHMLDLLEDYCSHKKWLYERIDGKVSGSERQVRIDRFNAQNSSRFCFLLSTRAGGLGINLATADTVIIYDSDWNPHADLQAMARAHRLGQTNKVMIYRLITRGTIEERMMQMTKKKMVLEHLVVGKLKAQNINQEELDDIIRYGSKELFADESDEAGKARQIHYDDAAIDRLLDREQIGDEEATVDDEEEDGFLKAFKVANFEYRDEVETALEEDAQTASTTNKTAESISESKRYWEELLKDRYEVHQIEEHTALGKGKRSRKQMASVDEDDLAGMDDVSSDTDSNEADWVDAEVSSGSSSGKKPCGPKKRARVDSPEPVPLMEGEGKSLKVLGFNHMQRTTFVLTLMRFGVGDYDWKEFVPRVKHKTLEEIKEYGMLFLSHIAEDISDSEFFSDGVPKEGLRIHDVLVRIAQLILIRDKVKTLKSKKPGTPLFAEDIIARYPGLRGGGSWKEEHDLKLLQGVLKHGYGKWQLFAEDKDLGIQNVICQQLKLPFLDASFAGGVQTNDDSNVVKPEGTSTDQLKETGGKNDSGPDVGHSAPANPNSYNTRELLRRLADFIKKRLLLLEKGLNAECQKEFFGDTKSCASLNEDPRNEQKVKNVDNLKALETVAQMDAYLPSIETITPQEISAFAYDDKTDRLEMARLYNEMCKVVSDNGQESVSRSEKIRNKFVALETINEEMHRLLDPLNQTANTSEHSVADSVQQTQQPDGDTNVLGRKDPKPSDNMDTELEADLATGSSVSAPSTLVEPTTSTSKSKVDEEMIDGHTDDAKLAGEHPTGTPDRVIVLDE